DNAVAYRYYAFKFANNWGYPSYMNLRRVELLSGSDTRKKFVLDDGTDLVSGRIPFAFTNGRLIDSANFLFDGTDLTIPATLITDKLKFTQTDGNEYIDSLADGYMDYGATTGHRFNNDVTVTGRISSSNASVSTDQTNYDVSGINTIFIVATDNTVTIGGFTGGVAGQCLHIVAWDVTNDITLQHQRG
ncbi:MAG: hypothetical protein ABIG46_05905, partial [Candidatus Omnitrophota bacterium]